MLNDKADMKDIMSAWFWFNTLNSLIFQIYCSNENIEVFLLKNSYFQNKSCDYRGLGCGDMNASKFGCLFCDFFIRLNRCRLERGEPFLSSSEISYQFELFCRGKKEFQDLKLSNSNSCYSHKNTSSFRSQTANKRNHQGKKLGPAEGQMCQCLNEGTYTRVQLENGKKCRGRNGYTRVHSCSYEIAPNVCCGGDHNQLIRSIFILSMINNIAFITFFCNFFYCLNS